ncbi:hypothetical protein Q9189_005002 [Teloschistes chrysophthalmus]
MPNSQAGWKPKLQVINRWRAGSRYGDTRATNEDISDEDDARWLLKSTAVLDSALCKHRQQTERRVNKLSSWAADAEALEPSMRTSNTPEGIPRRLGDQICTMRNSGAEWRTHPDNETKHQLQKHPEPHMRTTRTLDTFEGISWTKKESSHLPPLSGDGAPKSFLFSTTIRHSVLEKNALIHGGSGTSTSQAKLDIETHAREDLQCIKKRPRFSVLEKKARIQGGSGTSTSQATLDIKTHAREDLQCIKKRPRFSVLEKKVRIQGGSRTSTKQAKFSIDPSSRGSSMREEEAEIQGPSQEF